MMNDARYERLMNRVDAEARKIIDVVGDAEHAEAWNATTDLRDMLKAAIVHLYVYQNEADEHQRLLDHFMMDYPREYTITTLPKDDD